MFDITEQEVLFKACKIVEDELRKLRITLAQLHYSEGVTVSGEKGNAKAINIYETIMKLKSKLNEQ